MYSDIIDCFAASGFNGNLSHNPPFSHELSDPHSCQTHHPCQQLLQCCYLLSVQKSADCMLNRESEKSQEPLADSV